MATIDAKHNAARTYSGVRCHQPSKKLIKLSAPCAEGMYPEIKTSANSVPKTRA